MIDTFKVILSEADIDYKNSLTIVPADIDCSTGEIIGNYDLFVDNLGRHFNGKRAYYNDEKINVTVQNKYNIDKFLKDQNYKSINLFDNDTMYGNSKVIVQTSLPKFSTGSNFNSLTEHQELETISNIEKYLKDKVGISCNIQNASLSRVDTFLNVVTDNNFFSYYDLFNTLSATRKQKFEYAGTTFLYRNGEQQLCIYDKIYEMKNQDIDTKIYPKNVVRIENRLLKKRKIRNSLGFTKVFDLKNDMKLLKDNYLSEVTKDVFRYEPGEIEILTGDMLQKEMTLFKEQFGLRWNQKFLKMYGLAYLLKVANIETISAVYLAVSENRMKHSRVMRELKELRMNLELIRKNHLLTDRTNKSLYYELKEKFYSNFRKAA